MKTNLKVLIVDDDALALEVAAAALESHGYTVIKREEALGTMVLIRRERPDIVLLDLHMPGLSGDALS
jgi:CheY-like chemotaxis protein